MLKTLRIKMILICSTITALILTVVSVFAFSIFNHHYQNELKVTLENQLRNLVLILQQSKSVSHTYFKNLESTSNILVHIEDNGNPLLYTSTLESKETQRKLFDQAHNIAINDYNFNFRPYLAHSFELPTTLFRFEGENNKPYMAAITLFSTSKGHCTILLLKDLTSNTQYILHIQLLFLGIALCGIVFLVLFSFAFVSMAIKPIIESQKKQAEFIAAASHELRAPLTVIEAGMSSIHPKDEVQTAHFIHLMQDECTRMKRLISDLLTLARSDAMEWHMQFENIEPDSLLIDLYDNYHSLCAEHHLTFTLDLPDNLLPCIHADKERLKQALSILLDNALSYVPSGRSLTLSAHLSSKFLLLSVIDTGIGIRDTDKAHIFERFYQGDRSRHAKNHYGLGLSIAYEIVALHQGKLTLTDTPGGGCTFTIFLPLHSEKEKDR